MGQFKRSTPDSFLTSSMPAGSVDSVLLSCGNLCRTMLDTFTSGGALGAVFSSSAGWEGKGGGGLRIKMCGV